MLLLSQATNPQNHAKKQSFVINMYLKGNIKAKEGERHKDKVYYCSHDMLKN